MVGRRFLRDFYLHRFAPAVRSLFFRDLIRKTGNFGSTTWLGHPIWQNVLDLWTIQETIAEVRPTLLIECGTNRGGSSLFFDPIDNRVIDFVGGQQDLRARRLRLGLSMQTVAGRLGLSRGTIYRVERGKQAPSGELRRKLVRACSSEVHKP